MSEVVRIQENGGRVLSVVQIRESIKPAKPARKPVYKRAGERIPLGEALAKIDQRYGLGQDDEESEESEVVSERQGEVVQISERRQRPKLQERLDDIDKTHYSGHFRTF